MNKQQIIELVIADSRRHHADAPAEALDAAIAQMVAVLEARDDKWFASVLGKHTYGGNVKADPAVLALDVVKALSK